MSNTSPNISRAALKHANRREGSSGFAPAVQDVMWEHFDGVWKDLMAIPFETRKEVTVRYIDDIQDFIKKYDRGLSRKFDKALDALYGDEWLWEHEGYRRSTMDEVIEEEFERIFGRRAEKSAAARVADRYASHHGPVGDVLVEEWNKVHDIESSLEIAIRKYDQASSYKGAAGEKDAEAVIKATKDALKVLGKASLMFGRLMKAEQKFMKKHGHPDDYIYKTQTDFGFR